MILDFAGIIIMALLGGARLKQILLGEWWALPLFLHAIFSIFLLIFHRKPGKFSPFLQRLTSWASALMPMAIQINGEIPAVNRIISASGVFIAIWTLIILGKSFDVSPADRGIVRNGPYKWVRHPMYASELFSVLAIVIVDLSLRNSLITLGLIFTLIMRIRWEEKIISGYQEYSFHVRSRLLPGVW
jgi:protein-S-isoprenylcysteine O-methyltransferase Ste14